MGLTIQSPLTNLQTELLKVFATQLPDEDLLEIKRMIAKFMLDKARKRAEQVAYEKGYDDSISEQVLNAD